MAATRNGMILLIFGRVCSGVDWLLVTAVARLAQGSFSELAERDELGNCQAHCFKSASMLRLSKGCGHPSACHQTPTKPTNMLKKRFATPHHYRLPTKPFAKTHKTQSNRLHCRGSRRKTATREEKNCAIFVNGQIRFARSLPVECVAQG
jgi:hypothetical protein